MNLPSEFEQAVKYVMSAWPGSRSETESETVFSLHAYIKKITLPIKLTSVNQRFRKSK